MKLSSNERIIRAVGESGVQCAVGHSVHSRLTANTASLKIRKKYSRVRFVNWKVICTLITTYRKVQRIKIGKFNLRQKKKLFSLNIISNSFHSLTPRTDFFGRIYGLLSCSTDLVQLNYRNGHICILLNIRMNNVTWGTVSMSCAVWRYLTILGYDLVELDCNCNYCIYCLEYLFKHRKTTSKQRITEKCEHCAPLSAAPRFYNLCTASAHCAPLVGHSVHNYAPLENGTRVDE